MEEEGGTNTGIQAVFKRGGLETKRRGEREQEKEKMKQ